MILKRLFSRNAPFQPTPVAELYGAIVAAARQPQFYRDWAVPDTVDGRFEMIVVHLFLVMDRLKGGSNSRAWDPDIMSRKR